MLPVTVIIPCRNMAATLGRAIESAIEAGAECVIVIDDCSSDDSLFQVSQWRFHYGHDRLIALTTNTSFVPAGVVYARNLGVECAFTDLILPLDSDDYLLPGALERMAAAWKPGTWVYGNYDEVDSAGKLVQHVLAPVPGVLHRKNISGVTMLFHKDDWRAVGGYDSRWEVGGEDWEFQVALTHAGVQPVRLDGDSLYARTVGGSRTVRTVRYYPFILEMMKEKHPAFFQGK